MDDLLVPRSNMYKYVALSGVTIVIVTLIFSISQLYRIDDQILAARERVAVMNARLEASGDAGDETPPPELERRLDRIRLDSARNRIEVLENRSLELRQWATILFTIGVVVAAFGFTNWYRKIQMPLERIIQRRSERQVEGADARR